MGEPQTGTTLRTIVRSRAVADRQAVRTALCCIAAAWLRAPWSRLLSATLFPSIRKKCGAERGAMRCYVSERSLYGGQVQGTFVKWIIFDFFTMSEWLAREGQMAPGQICE